MFMKQYIPKSLWQAQYQPMTADPLETDGDDLQLANDAAKTAPKHVWTLVETPYGESIVPGLHFSNRVGFFVTARPCNNQQLEVLV